jgi:hypothetical protein
MKETVFAVCPGDRTRAFAPKNTVECRSPSPLKRTAANLLDCRQAISSNARAIAFEISSYCPTIDPLVSTQVTSGPLPPVSSPRSSYCAIRSSSSRA